VVDAGTDRITVEEGSEVISVEDVARVLAWADGSTPEEIAHAGAHVLWLDSAQACLEDITEAKK
jgi:hypothetical protein